MKIANYNNHVKNNKMKNNYSKKLKFRTTINLMIIYYLLIIIISPNEVIGQTQQFTSNPTMAIPQMEWINMDSKYPSTNTVVPPGLKNFAFGYHSDSKNVIIYGGSSSGGGVSGQTYMLDLNTMLWRNPTTDPKKTGPDPRTRMLFGIDKYSSYRDQLVIFGGKGNGDTVYNDIWSFNVPYFTWTQISNISPSASIIPQMYDTLGGIDSTINNSNNTMWITHGTNGTNFFNEAWAIGLGGSWAPGNNGLTANIVKVDMSSSSVIPSGRREAGGAILPNNRIVTYGGCNNTSPVECAIPETFTLQLNSDGVTPPAYNAKPFWAEQNRCLGSREEAAMVMVGKKPQDNLAVVFGGKAANGTGIGGDGEVGVLDANLGTWVRVLPKPDPVYNVPKARAGARMLSAQTALLGSATDVVDILMYGGEALDGSLDVYNDLWILRLYTGIPISQSTSNSTATVKFLDCIVEDVSTTSVSPPSPSSSGTYNLPTGKNPGSNSTKSDGQDFADAIVPISHLLFSTIGYLLLVVSFSIVRFGYNSKFKLLVGISYALLLVSSCAIAFYGFSVAFIDVRDDLASHFSSFHGLVGVILIILLYVLVPLLALILLFMTKSFDPPNNNNDEKLIKTIDHDNAYNANKGGFLNKLSAISNRNPFKKGSNDDYSDSNGKSKTFEVTRQSLSIMKSVSDDNDWMEQRRSVSLADSHKAVNSFGSRNNSLQNNLSQNSDASSPGSRLGTGLGLSSSSNNNFKTNIDNSDDSNHRKNNSSSSNVSHGNRSNIDDKPNNSIMIVRHIFHIITQIILLLGAIYIAYYLGATKMLDRVYCIIFIALVAFVYLVWLFAAWLGYPKDRGSLLVSFAAKYCGGRDNYLPYSNEGDESDDEGKREVTAVSPSPLNITNANSGKNDVDEDAEQDMRDREVVVMTIPKRRLAVVNV